MASRVVPHRAAMVAVTGSLKRFNATVPVVPMILDGKEVQSTTKEFFDIHDPATGRLIARTPLCTPSELHEAAESSAEAYKVWRKVPPSSRARVMHKLEDAIRDSTEELAEIVTREQ